MARLLHPLLLLVARATEWELARYVEYLKAENRILRSKLPKRVTVTVTERKRLLELGLRVGPAIKELHHDRYAANVRAVGKWRPLQT